MQFCIVNAMTSSHNDLTTSFRPSFSNFLWKLVGNAGWKLVQWGGGKVAIKEKTEEAERAPIEENCGFIGPRDQMYPIFDVSQKSWRLKSQKYHYIVTRKVS